MNIIIDENDTGQRTDIFLSKILPDISRSKIQNGIKTGAVKVNGNIIKSSYKLKEDDELVFDDKDFTNSIKIEPENIPLEIVWEDENMTVINKPSGMLTHPTSTENTNTLVNALLYKYGENLSDKSGAFRRGIVHRLDKNTSGLIMIAKNNKTHEYLEEQIKLRNFKKIYRAIVKGVIEEDYLEINSPIGRNPNNPIKMGIVDGGKESLSLVRVIERFKDTTHIEVELVTGRTHQIRVHLSSINHPIYNDTLYGFGKPKIKTQEQVLQSCKLEFLKPFSDKVISLEIPPDEDFVKVVNSITVAAK